MSQQQVSQRVSNAFLLPERDQWPRLLADVEFATQMGEALIQKCELLDGYGARAIEAVRPWLATPVLAAFAVRVIERAGKSGDRELAARVLRSARREASPPIRADIDWALARLRAAQRGPAE